MNPNVETELADSTNGSRIKVSPYCYSCSNKYEYLYHQNSSIILECPQCSKKLVALDIVGGFVYVLSNKSIPNLVKIGFTTRSVEERVAELNAPTSVPTPFDIEASFPVTDPTKTEQLIHDNLSKYRTNENREFFSLTSIEAIKQIRLILESYINYEEQKKLKELIIPGIEVPPN